MAVLAALAFFAAAGGVWHSHSDLSSKACQTCHVSSLPALHAAPALVLVPAVVTGKCVGMESAKLHEVPVLSADSPRGPPQLA